MQKAPHAFIKLRYLKNILRYQKMRIIYYLLIENHLRYDIVARGGAVETHIHPLEVLQISKIAHL